VAGYSERARKPPRISITVSNGLRSHVHLADVFAVSVLSYAVMSNHFHIVFSVQPAVANAWTDREVAERWCKLYPREAAEKTAAKVEEIFADESRIQIYRRHLANLSWFMKSIAEPLARFANIEDKVTGRCWAGSL